MAFPSAVENSRSGGAIMQLALSRAPSQVRGGSHRKGGGRGCPKL